MKGIILIAGAGTRLYPLTKMVNKPLLPVYDKPMLYYPLSTLMLFGIRDILVICAPKDLENLKKVFGDGSELGLNMSFAVQEKPRGIADAFLIGEDFIAGDEVCLILGDNIFYMGDNIEPFRKEIAANEGATVFGFRVCDPERFGVVEFDENFKALSLEEKPKQPKSNYAVVGLYFYKPDVVEKAKRLTPSARGELEITDINKMYLEEKKLNVVVMRRGNVWLDAGTPETLNEASQFVEIVEKRQGLKISCIEEIAFRRGFIDNPQMEKLIEQSPKGTEYRAYLQRVYEEYKS